MMFSTKQQPASSPVIWISCLAVLFLFMGCKKWHEPPVAMVTTVASGLMNPMGIETDGNGNIWVSEGETVNNDGSVWVVRPNGKKFKAIVNLAAFTNPHSNEPQGTSHLLLNKGYLYVLSGYYLYKIDVSHFTPGDKPINAAKLPYEDIGAWVLKYPFKGMPNDSHPYNMTIGPDGDLYIADAGANAIIHRHAANKYSVLAEFPSFMNPTPVGPPVVQAVPTGLLYDGKDFLVSTLTGFPFLEGKAVIYKVSRYGKVSVYQDKFTTLTDIAEGSYGHRIVVHHADFVNFQFVHNTGSLLWADGTSSVQLVGGLDMPVGIKQHNDHTWFVTCLGDGTVKKVTWQ